MLHTLQAQRTWKKKVTEPKLALFVSQRGTGATAVFTKSVRNILAADPDDIHIHVFQILYWIQWTKFYLWTMIPWFSAI